jgi:hypothetical protein
VYIRRAIFLVGRFFVGRFSGPLEKRELGIMDGHPALDEEVVAGSRYDAREIVKVILPSVFFS